MNQDFFLSCIADCTEAAIKINTIDFTYEYCLAPRRVISDSVLREILDILMPFRGAHANIKELNGTVLPIWEADEKWLSIHILVPSTWCEDNPDILAIVQASPPQDIPLLTLQNTIEKRFFKIAIVYLNQDEGLYFRHDQKRGGILHRPNARKHSEELKLIVEHRVHPDDKEYVNKYLNSDFLKKEYLRGKQTLSFYYRRFHMGEFRWVRALIIPAIGSTKDNPILVILNEDYESEALKDMATISRYQYQLLMERQNSDISESFYTDVLNLLKNLMEPYELFIVIDLRENVFLSFKTFNVFHDPYYRASGEYSTVVKKYLYEQYNGDKADELAAFSDLTNIRNQLQEKSSIEISYHGKGGKPMRLTIYKTESIDGEPVKAVMAATIDNSNNELLQIKTFGNFQVLDRNNQMIKFEKAASKQVLAFLIDRKGYPVTIKDIILEMLEKDETDLNAQKYASGIVRKAIRDLCAAGYDNVIIAENRTYRINTDAVDCDLYHLLRGEKDYLRNYHDEYMKEYSWAEETNAELMDREYYGAGTF